MKRQRTVQSGGWNACCCYVLRERLLEVELLQMDETTVQVLKEPGRAATSISYMWVQRGATPDHPL